MSSTGRALAETGSGAAIDVRTPYEPLASVHSAQSSLEQAPALMPVKEGRRVRFHANSAA